MQIAVLYSMPTRRALASPYADTEEDTVESAEEVAKALESKGARVTRLGIDEDHIERIQRIRGDLVFNLIDWTGLDLPLSDSALSEIEYTKIPYSGATRMNYLQTSDKVTMKKLLAQHGLPTPRFQVFERGDEEPRKDFHYPVIMKPALEHCSIGLTHEAVVDDIATLKKRVADRVKQFNEQIVVEEFISGREFQVTVIDTGKSLPAGRQGLRVLPPAEIAFDTKGEASLLTYESRWDDSTVDYKSSHVALPVLDPKFLASIETVTQRTFAELGFRDYARLDIRTRGLDISILEANSNPGLSDDMEYGMTLSYKAAGWTFADFIWKIVESAMRRA